MIGRPMPARVRSAYRAEMRAARTAAEPPCSRPLATRKDTDKRPPSLSGDSLRDQRKFSSYSTCSIGLPSPKSCLRTAPDSVKPLLA